MAAVNRMLKFFKRGRQFDLPFHARLGTEFLVFLTGLMTLLCLLAVTASLALTDMAGRWTSGLENTLTVEIPAGDEQAILSAKMIAGLKDAPGVKSVQLMSQNDMAELLSPWLGNGSEHIKDLPMPALITVELKNRAPVELKTVIRTVHEISPQVQVDAHEQWLTDLVKFTRLLKLVALCVMVAIGIVTSLTVGGAVRSRMAIHHTELELLHVMGADDQYISGQFQRYIGLLTGRGILVGLIVSLSVVGGLQMVSYTSSQVLPALNIDIVEFLALLAAALVLLLISLMTARLTVLKVLRSMP